MTRILRFGGQETPTACDSSLSTESPASSTSEPRPEDGLADLLAQLSWKYVTPEATFTTTYEVPDDPDALAEDIAHWAGRVWIHEHEMPSGQALADFDILSLEPDFRRYITEHGASLFDGGLAIDEVWASQALYNGSLPVLFVNEAYADLPLDRIEPKKLCSSQALVWLQAALQMALPGGDPWNVLVTNGRSGHTIGITGLNGVEYRHPRQLDVPVGWFSFHDPWPARSLLCPDRHDYGVQVVEDVANPPFWLIPPEGLDQIIVGFLVPIDLLASLAPYFAALDLAESLQRQDGRPLWFESRDRPDAYFPLLIADHGGTTPTAERTMDGLRRLAFLTA